MQNNMIKKFIAILLLLSANIVFSAGVYKWTDADGNIHYGDRPVDSAEKIKVKSGHKPDPRLREHQQKRDRLLEVFDDERREKRSEKALAMKQKAKQQQKCSDAQEKLQQYKTAGYLYKLGDNGERTILGDEEHAAALETAQDSVKHWCG